MVSLQAWESGSEDLAHPRNSLRPCKTSSNVGGSNSVVRLHTTLNPMEELRWPQRKSSSRKSHQVHGKAQPTLQSSQGAVPGDKVFVQNQTGRHWNKWEKSGTVIESKGNHCYNVKIDGTGRVTPRNRQFLWKFDLVYLTPALIPRMLPLPASPKTTEPQPASRLPNEEVPQTGVEDERPTNDQTIMKDNRQQKELPPPGSPGAQETAGSQQDWRKGSSRGTSPEIGQGHLISQCVFMKQPKNFCQLGGDD